MSVDSRATATLSDQVIETFERAHATGLLGERRDGQVEMALAVAAAIEAESHLLVRAGTGIGKTWAYLVPALLSGSRVVVATATRSLQEQLASRDLPRLREALGVDFNWAVLKGRSNYVCRERAAEAAAATPPAGEAQAQVRLLKQIDTARSGDRDEFDSQLQERVWRRISVRHDECPGRARCPSGEACFAETARDLAAEADVIVTNHHVYAAAIFASDQILPEHEVAIFDEAHRLDETFRQATTARLDPAALSRMLTGEAPEEGYDLKSVLRELQTLQKRLGASSGAILVALPPDLRASLEQVKALLQDYAAAARARSKGEAQQRWARRAHACSLAVENLALLLEEEDRVRWLEGTAARPVFRGWAPQGAWTGRLERLRRRTAVLTSATVEPAVAAEIGLPEEETETLEIPSPFPYEKQGLVYCPTEAPDPRDPAWQAVVHDNLVELIAASGGRALILFTSWRALEGALESVAPRIEHEVLAQGSVTRPELLARLRGEVPTCVFGTVSGMGEGIDVPGDALTLVAVDRLPFPPRDDPFLIARRRAKGSGGFREVDLRYARTLLTQAAGRLIRSTTDRGCFAVLDPRLGRASYGPDLVRALPPMRRTKDLRTACDFLAAA